VSNGRNEGFSPLVTAILEASTTAVDDYTESVAELMLVILGLMSKTSNMTRRATLEEPLRAADMGRVVVKQKSAQVRLG
jgi:hypothetical protein